MPDKRPFTPKTLALRWHCSDATIRNRCASGEIPHFRLGGLYRIPAHVVREIEECQTSQLDDSEVDSASVGQTQIQENGGAISLPHAPEKKRRQKH